MSPELMNAILGGVIGGVLGVIGTLLSSYYGPRNLELWRENRKEQKEYGPRKVLLEKMLKDPQFPDGRLLETLCLVTGTSKEDCRRLLIEIDARGIMLKNGNEGWVLISKKPLNEL